MEYSVIKVWYEREGGEEPEIRRFSVPQDVVSTYKYIHHKVSEVFTELKHGNFSMYWKDNEDDLVMFSSQEELDEALCNVTDSVLKLVVKATKACDRAGRVTSPGRTGLRHGWRWAARGGLGNNSTETIPQRFVSRGMRKSRGHWQQEKGEATPGKEPARMQGQTPEDGTDCTPGKWRRSFVRHRGEWQQDVVGQYRPRRGWANEATCGDRDHGAGHKEHLSNGDRQPSVRPIVLGWEERVYRRKQRRQQMLQEFQSQQQTQPDDSHVGFYPRWRSTRAARNTDTHHMPPVHVMSHHGYGMDGGCRGFRAGGGAQCTDGCSELPARRGDWRRKVHGRHHEGGDDESFASCQRRRFRRMRREAMMKGFELSEGFGSNQRNLRRNRPRSCEKTATPEANDEEQTTIGTEFGFHGRMRRSAYLRKQGQCPTMSAAKFEKLKNCRGTGETNFQVRNHRMRFQPRRESGLAAYRLRVLRRQRRQRFLQRFAINGCHQPVHGLRRGPFHAFRQPANQSRHGRSPYWTERLRRGSRNTFDSNTGNMRWNHLIRKCNRRANERSFYPTWRIVCSRPMRQGCGQKVSHPITQHCQLKFVKSTPRERLSQKPTCPQIWRNAVEAHLVKTLLKKQRRMKTFGSPRCGRPRPAPWRSGFRHWSHRPLYNSQAH